MVNITCKQARCKESGTQQKRQPRIRNAKHSLGQQSPCYLSPQNQTVLLKKNPCSPHKNIFFPIKMTSIIRSLIKSCLKKKLALITYRLQVLTKDVY